MIGYVTPELLTFLGIATIAAILIWKRATHGKSGAGFNFMVFGVTYIAVAVFLDYIIDTPASKLLLQIFSRDTWHLLLQLGVYFPGSLCVGVGIFRWLPSILQLEDEIAQRKQAELRVIDSEKQYQNLLEGSIQGVLITSVDRKPIVVNQKCVEIFGYDSIEEFLKLENTESLIAPHEIDRLDKIRAPYVKEISTVRSNMNLLV